mmetsp:Transcript_81161/g.211637  ORF Transcript_81161/g.211637 Transcript_81161/m.211637 type:complete len:320 (-) Transcript_81161:196-1155(-)
MSRYPSFYSFQSTTGSTPAPRRVPGQREPTKVLCQFCFFVIMLMASLPILNLRATFVGIPAISQGQPTTGSFSQTLQIPSGRKHPRPFGAIWGKRVSTHVLSHIAVALARQLKEVVAKVDQDVIIPICGCLPISIARDQETIWEMLAQLAELVIQVDCVPVIVLASLPQASPPVAPDFWKAALRLVLASLHIGDRVNVAGEQPVVAASDPRDVKQVVQLWPRVMLLATGVDRELDVGSLGEHSSEELMGTGSDKEQVVFVFPIRTPSGSEVHVSLADLGKQRSIHVNQNQDLPCPLMHQMRFVVCLATLWIGQGIVHIL